MVTDEDLDEVQRAWAPRSGDVAMECWPYWHSMEWYGGELVFVPDGAWDWRSVAMVARAYPGWRVVLEDDGVITAKPPDRP